jgi:hypothetical protein
MAKRARRQPRNIMVMTRWNAVEYKMLADRRKRSGAKTDPEYIRAAALTGDEFQMPAFETVRDLRNEMIRLSAAVQALPQTRLRDEVLLEARGAFRRLCR